MRAARQSPAVVLQEYNNLRSKVPGKPIFSFEGFEDTIFYGVMAQKFELELDYGVLVCRGKDRVLDLRELLARNKSEDARFVWYFVDQDFDGLKGRKAGTDIYCTSTYSFENSIVGGNILRQLLEGEFRCVGSDGQTEISRAVDFFSQVSSRYFESFRQVNLAVFSLRRKNICAGPIDSDFKKYATISINGYKCNLSPKRILELTGAAKSLELDQLMAIMSELENEFDALDPLTGWRGKFHLAMFQKVLSALKEDRGRKKDRIVFSSHALVDTNFDGNIVRILSSLARVPSDLEDFFSEVLSANRAQATPLQRYDIG
jgi:hypothetical protein